MRGTRTDARRRRHFRVRKSVHGTQTRPRLAVFRSNRHIYAQIIDDDGGRTLASASSGESAVKTDRLTIAVATSTTAGSRRSLKLPVKPDSSSRSDR
jgi:large subunit ribosomal protein L18